MSEENKALEAQATAEGIPKHYPLKASAAWASGTFLASLPFEVFGHFGPTGLLLGGLASFVAFRHGPEMYEHLSDRMRELLPSSTQAQTSEALEGRASEDTTERSWLERAFGYYPPGYAQPVQAGAEEASSQNDADDEPPTRKLGPQQETWEESWYDGDEEELAGPGIERAKSFFTFSEVLASGFVPSLSAIYLGRKSDGTPITVPAKDLCHVALPGATGHGKSSLIRLLMSQLCACGLPVYLLNPHYTIFDREHHEDWTPFTPYLKSDPLACMNMSTIKTVLEWMMNTLLPQRKERVAKGGRVGKPYFFILDEVPDIVASIPGASKMIGKLLREGRKYGIYLVIASQDFSVKTLGMEGEGSLRKCFHTILYVGGDPISVRELLNARNGKVGDLLIDENSLGMGSIIVRYMDKDREQGTVQTVLTEARTPYTDNESLYHLLGPSTFTPDDEGPDDAFPSPRRGAPAPSREIGNREEQQEAGAPRYQSINDIPIADLTAEQLIAAVLQLPALHPQEEENGSFSPELPGVSRKPNLSVVPPFAGSSQESPQDRMNEPGEPTEYTPETFEPRGDDLQLSELQAELLIVYYRHCNNINKSLEQIKNDKGQGLGGRYYRHASYLLEQRGLKKRKA